MQRDDHTAEPALHSPTDVVDMDDRAGELTLSHQRSGREAYLCARGGFSPQNVHSTGHAADDDFALHHSSNADFPVLN